MKGLVFVYLLIVCGLGVENFNQIDGLKQQVGQSCQDNSEFQISGFNVSPWPLANGIRFTITMSGTFLHDAEVSTEYIKRVYNGKSNDTTIDVNTKYKSGDYHSFVVNDMAGSLSGVYTYTLGLHWKKIFYDVVLTCWTFTYQI